eukprot:CAMPEP_0172490422 /NCGR_PEP_ID=MMETSP1066-20121228/20838_1 /TAXON_ID=671091 /ORGANISM="Coscinodiscus wailesii, Strain CCMP2513" /LENGTH=1235 /DNA_ID=CAMNT_0013258877 /DNA_START=78 /DNA_END=3785 /DNA_ORIENTATION=-
MHVQEVVIDGFKSYARKTVITGFDPHFNAITGLNGSGKSNILDSICFVLGISNLSAVRAGNLSELVYKKGQAGVTKAVVTIVFDNRDKSGSPVGYEDKDEVTVTRQVLIGGKSKYLINGKNQNMNQVTNLFHSVQLNVNNPHFLIMQGRITKVLNMKPAEILAMVEEAAGTRMYETKRLAALKTIDKKQMKLDELNTILAEEITPTLERLRGEKQHYLKWSKNGADIERFERFVVAYDYTNAIEVVERSENGAKEVEEELQKQEEAVVTCQNEIEATEEEISSLSEKLTGEFDGTHKSVKSNEESMSKELVKATSAWQNSVTAVEDATADRDGALKLVKETSTLVSRKEKSLEKATESIASLKKEMEEAEAEVTKLSNDYQNKCAGIASGDDDESAATIPAQIAKAHSEATTAEAKVKQNKMTISKLTKSVKTVEKDMKKEEGTARSLTKKRDMLQKKEADLQATLNTLTFDPETFAKLESHKKELSDKISGLSDKISFLEDQLKARLNFTYKDPVKGFDRSKVKGLIARLITVKNPNHATALEVVAKNKLYQVVVDEAIVGKALLNKGKLQRRVTIIPLDKIQSRIITSATSQQAASIAQKMKSTSYPAIELVGFDEDVRAAIEYVFGGTLVVDGMDAADKICSMTRTKAVTLDGDVFDPAGTISGGSKQNLGSTLGRLAEWAELKKQFTSVEADLAKVDAEWRSGKSVGEKHSRVTDELELAQAELKAATKHLGETSFGRLKEQFETLKQDIENATTEMEAMQKEKKTKWALHKELKEKEADLTRMREERLKEVEKEVQDAKKRAEKAAKSYRKAEAASQDSTLELRTLKNDLLAAEEAVTTAEKFLSEAQSSSDALKAKVAEQKALYDKAKAELDDVESKIANLSKEIKALNSKKSRLQKRKESEEVAVKKLSIKVQKYEKEKLAAERFVQNMVKKHSWINDDKEYFGVPGGDYDFSDAEAASKMSQTLKKLKEEQAGLAKKINKKVMGMIEKAEGEYTELLRKRKVVENDKKKIQSVIEELDAKKKSELERTWVKVNTDFGSIFSTLLPGASARLAPPEGMEAYEGLEVKVAFGNVWKESLSELSGGQRSLLALSLILSMLLFKPAPMYILDEVDAALDLSHTQNIGQMLRSHFSQSQFIVVSLKEGMFNNANVIFRTKFVEGVSTVTRTLGVGASSKARALASSNGRGKKATEEDDEDEEFVVQPARKRLAAGTRGSRRGVARSGDKENQ